MLSLSWLPPFFSGNGFFEVSSCQLTLVSSRQNLFENLSVDDTITFIIASRTPWISAFNKTKHV